MRRSASASEASSLGKLRVISSTGCGFGFSPSGGGSGGFRLRQFAHLGFHALQLSAEGVLMAEQLFQPGETERCLGLELVETGAETVLIIEADAAPLRRTLNGSRLGLKQRRLLGL